LVEGVEALGPVLAGPVFVGTALGAELADPTGPVLAGPVLAGPVLAGPVFVEPAPADADGADAVVPPWHEAPLMVQLVGWPAVPADFVTKPTVAVVPGWTVASQPSLVTVTWLPWSVYEPFQSELISVPAGSVKARVQPVTTLVPGLVMVYCPL